MASIVDIERIKAPKFSKRGNEAGTYAAEWFVEVDDYVPGARVLQLAQAHSGVSRVPRSGETFRWTAGGETLTDSGARALEFDVEYYDDEKDFPTGWRINVTWRPPQPGADEQPGSFDLPPLARPPEFWIEYDLIEHIVSEGYVVDPITIQLTPGPNNFVSLTEGNFGPLRNAAGEQFSVHDAGLMPVMVKQQNVATDLEALRLNNEFERTTNSTTWTCRGLNVSPHFAKFLRAETGQQITEGKWRYFRMQVRVAIARLPFYDVRPHRASFHYVSAGGKWLQEAHMNADGTIAIDGPITHNRGQRETGQSGRNNTQGNLTDGSLRWLLYTPVNYTDEPLLRFT